MFTRDAKYHQLIEIPGFPGYYVNRVNDVVSFHRMAKGRDIRVKYSPDDTDHLRGYFFLKQHDGVRVSRGRKKLLLATLGHEEFGRREKNRKNFAGTYAQMVKEFLVDYHAMQRQKVAAESRQLREQLKNARMSDIKNTLGELF